MSNSSLVKYKRISPNQYGKRNHKIDTITIHCMAGQLTAEQCGAVFAPSSRQASSNYGVGKDGKIGMYVEENCASWCTSNYANDQRAVTIEVASDSRSPYKVTDAAYKSTINLVYDICKRNKIKKLKWSTSKSDRVNHKNGCNMTVHCDYANKACPGEYLYSHMGDIAKKVNAKLSGGSGPKVGSTLTLKEDAKLYEHAYKDPAGGASKGIKVKKGTKVKFIKDDKTGWSKVKYNGKERWILNSHLNAKLSSHPKVKLKKDRKGRQLIDNKLSKAVSILKKGTTVTQICIIESGKYKNYSYVGIDKKRYYIKNL
jgi:hypothetical protein